MAPQSSPFAIASSRLGLSEAAPALKDFLYTGGQNLDPVTRAWCADFVNASLREAGMKGTGSGMARSFLNYGQPVDQPQKGDIAVFTRGDPNGPSGHVGFFDGLDANGNVRVLGGNQGNAVSLASYPASRLLGYRRPGDAVPTEAQPTAPPADSQIAAYPWTPGQPEQAQPAPAPAPESPQPQQMAGLMPQPQAQSPSLSFEQIGKMLGLEDPPPLQPIQPIKPRFPMAPSAGPFFRRA